MINYAELNKITDFKPNTITVSTNSAIAIAGTVDVTNNSIYVTGTNTKFAHIHSLGNLPLGSSIVVNNTIRIVSNIISNTNISVTSVFTSNASAQTMIILT